MCKCATFDSVDLVVHNNTKNWWHFDITFVGSYEVYYWEENGDFSQIQIMMNLVNLYFLEVHSCISLALNYINHCW